MTAPVAPASDVPGTLETAVVVSAEDVHRVRHRQPAVLSAVGTACPGEAS